MKKCILPLILATSVAFSGGCKTLDKKVIETEPLDKYKDFFLVKEDLILEDYSEKVISSGSVLTEKEPYENMMTFSDPQKNRTIFLMDIKDETSIYSEKLKYDNLEVIIIVDQSSKINHHFSRNKLPSYGPVEEVFKRADEVYNYERGLIKEKLKESEEKLYQGLNQEIEEATNQLDSGTN